MLSIPESYRPKARISLMLRQGSQNHLSPWASLQARSYSRTPFLPPSHTPFPSISDLAATPAGLGVRLCAVQILEQLKQVTHEMQSSQSFSHSRTHTPCNACECCMQHWSRTSWTRRYVQPVSQSKSAHGVIWLGWSPQSVAATIARLCCMQHLFQPLLDLCHIQHESQTGCSSCQIRYVEGGGMGGEGKVSMG